MIRETLIALACILCVSASHPKTDEEVEIINKSQNLWFAAPNEVSRKGMKYYRRLLGGKISKHKVLPVNENITLSDAIPTTFDARTAWSYCSSIALITDQSNCGSCWAISPAACLSDRLCISTHGRTQISISAEDILTCCSDCIDPHTKGCDGGYSERAYNFFKKSGVVTGGYYHSNIGCQPYAIAPSRKSNQLVTPPCQKKCTNKSYKIPYSKDKHFGKSAYSLPQDIARIQSEIMEYGPVTATFDAYSDFRYYNHGIYVKTSSQKIETHSVKVIGWGTEGGVDYWLGANSWGTNWGLRGFFKIRRGTNECGFESHMTAGLTTA